VAAAAVVIHGIGGWGNISAQTDKEKETERTLRDLQISMAPEPNVPFPEAFQVPPKISEQIVGGVSEWKLFYFCRYHTSDELKKIIHEQFATNVFDEKKPDKPPINDLSTVPAEQVRCSRPLNLR